MSEWTDTKNQLVEEIVGLGFPEQLGDEVAKNLGSPKAMRRMISYLREVKPKKAELVVDEMLAICFEIENWRDKKESQEANAAISMFLRYGLTEEDMASIEVFIQNSIRITGEGRRIYIDPFRMEEEPHDADIVFITHDHYDHYSPEDIEKVCKGGTVLVIPAKMKAKEVLQLVAEVVSVIPGNHYEISGISVDTVAAYNKHKPFHPKHAGWVGYILTVDGERIYIAGDTDATDEAMQVRCDTALVPIGGTFTMDAKKAAELINVIKPKVAIPVHYGDLVGSKEDADVFVGLVKEPVRVMRIC